jgi:hypothetical protein
VTLKGFSFPLLKIGERRQSFDKRNAMDLSGDFLNPVASSMFSLVMGDVVGVVTDRVSSALLSRVDIVEKLKLGSSTSSLLNDVLALALQTGMITLSVEMVTSAMPWITREPASFTLFILAMWATSPGIKSSLRRITDALFTHQAAGNAQEATIAAAVKETTETPESEPASSE